MNDKSRGCIWWLQCGNKHKIWTPFFLVLSITVIFWLCVLWPSSIRSARFCFETWEWRRKKSNHSANKCSCIHSDGWQANLVSGGAPSKNASFTRTSGKINIGGINVPAALLQITAVTRLPRSADVWVPTCFQPLSATIFEGHPWSVVIPLSSTLNIFPGVIFFPSLVSSSISKNEYTFVLLNYLARAADVGSGVRKERLCRFKNDVNQCHPAFCLTWLNRFGILFFTERQDFEHLNKLIQNALSPF